MPTPLPLVKSIESVTQTGAGQGSSYYLYDAQNRLSRQVEGAGSAAEHLIYLEGYEDRVGGYRTRSYVDDYAHVTRYRYGQLELRFVLTDRLGSVVGVVRADRDSGGSVRALEPEVELAYDVFGAPRHASDWSPLVGTESWPQARSPWDVTPTTRHGFTGHEMLSKQRLIHMRGRLFDPRMGRFTGVDPVIQFPLSTQGLNPYSYLLNNPLAGTDPTGYATCFVDEDWASSACAAEGTHTIMSSEGENLGKIHNGSDRVSYVPTAAGHAFQSGAQRVQGERTEQHQESSDKESADSRSNMPTVGDKVAKAPILLGYRPDDNADRSMGDAFLHKAIGYPVGLGDIGYSAPAGSGEVNEVGLPGDIAAAKLFLRAFRVAKVALTGLLKGADDLMQGGAGAARGPGQFVSVSESMSARAAAYQTRAAGSNAGTAYVVNGVKFDGYASGVLIDAKSGYAQFVKGGQFRPWFRGAESLAAQAQRQLGAAGGTPIQWRFAEESAANATRSLFQQRGISGIDIVHFP